MIPGAPDPVAGPAAPGGPSAPAGPSGPRVSVYNIANGLTVLRILMVPVFVWLLLQDGTAWRLAAFAAFALASVTDKIDGDLARSRGLVTDFGKIADPIADKALTGAALIGLSALGELWWWVTAVILVREIGVTVLRFVVIRYGVIPASKGGKLKTMLQVIAIGFYILPGPLDYVRWATMGAALVVTVVTGVDYVVRAWRMRRPSADAS